MRRIVGAAIAAGVLAGAAGAAVQADQGAPVPRPAVKAQAISVPVSAREPGRLPDGRYSPNMVHYRVHDPKIAVRLPDPAGGPEWAVQVFDAERVNLKKPARTLAGAKVIGRNRCAQLGRVQDGVFGWIYGDGRFRPTRLGGEYQLIQCTSRKRPALTASFASTLGLADPADPKLTGSIVWGLAPAPVDVAGTGGADGAAQAADGVFLELGSADAKPGAGARIEAGGKTLALGPSRAVPDFGGRIKIRFPTPIPGSERVEARAPDPGGGPGYGLQVAQTRERKGVPCVSQPQQIAGGRSGYVNLRLALFTGGSGLGPGSCRPLSTAPGDKRPCDDGYGFGSDEFEGEDAFQRRARDERRLLAGRTTVYGQCSADVVRVTVSTPRDTRTLVPSPVGHAFLAVYDGDFPAGELVITAHLRSGKTWTERHPLGF